MQHDEWYVVNEFSPTCSTVHTSSIENIPTLKDSYGVFEQFKPTFDGFPTIKHLACNVEKSHYYNNVYVSHGSRKAMAYAHATSGQITMKMLQIYGDGNEHNYREICEKLFPEKGYGHDIDCWRGLETNGMIKFSSKHSRGRKFYKITDFGREVLSIVNANQVYFKPTHWFKIKGEACIEAAIMKADLAGEEDAWRDLEPSSFTSLLEALFDPKSKIRSLGSACRWLNNVIYLMKSNYSFFEKMNVPEVIAWLEANKTSPEVSRFYKIFSKTARRHAVAIAA